MKYFCFVIITLLAISCNNNTNDESNFPIKGALIGQKFSDTTACVFAPGLVSTQYSVRDAAFSPDDKYFVYSIKGPNGFDLLYFQNTPGGWQGPELLTLSTLFDDLEPAFSADGKYLYFASSRPKTDGGTTAADFDIYRALVTSEGFGPAQNIGAPVNTGANEFYPALDREGSLFFCANYGKNGIGGEDIYQAKKNGNNFQTPQNLGGNINTPADEFNSTVSRDGKMLIFTTMGRGAGFGGGDLWMSIKENQQWQVPQNMGKKINTPSLEYSPGFSPDQKYLFFSSNRRQKSMAMPKNYSDLLQLFNRPQNGSLNIYWIKMTELHLFD